MHVLPWAFLMQCASHTKLPSSLLVLPGSPARLGPAASSCSSYAVVDTFHCLLPQPLSAQGKRLRHLHSEEFLSPLKHLFLRQQLIMAVDASEGRHLIIIKHFFFSSNSSLHIARCAGDATRWIPAEAAAIYHFHSSLSFSISSCSQAASCTTTWECAAGTRESSGT